MIPAFTPSVLSLRIQDLALDDRPREKLLNKGPSALSEAELIAILIGSGTPKLSAIALAQWILKHFDHDLDRLAQTSIEELTAFKGIGTAKAITIVSALELTRRRLAQALPAKPFLTSSRDVYQLMKADLYDKTHEESWVLLLNNSSRLIHKARLSIGGITQTTVDTRIIFKLAALHNATQLILIHNHPSGSPFPSQADIRLTKKLLHAATFNDYLVIDHLIFSRITYFSFKDEGLLEKLAPS